MLPFGGASQGRLAPPFFLTRHGWPMQVITTEQLIAMLATVSPQPVTIATKTTPAMRRRGNPYLARGVVRLATRNGFIGPSYESVVNRQRLRESRQTDDQKFPLFKAGKLWNGKGRRVTGNRHLVMHIDSGKRYLVFFPQRTISSRYEYGDTGRKIPDSRIEKWLHASSRKPSTHQGTKKPIAWRVIALENLCSITISGEQYLIKDPTTDVVSQRKAA